MGRHHNRGCSGSNARAVDGRRPVATTSSSVLRTTGQLAPVTTPGSPIVTAAPTTAEPYDCRAGYAKWESEWSQARKDWCCWHKSHGCPKSTSSVALAKPYNCLTEDSWAPQKKSWCCRNTGLGCAEETSASS